MAELAVADLPRRQAIDTLDACEHEWVPDEQPAVDVCPGCGRAVEPEEDYVSAWEYKLEPGFELHAKPEHAQGTERRFHVGHFRGRTDDFHYELIADSEGRQQSQ